MLCLGTTQWFWLVRPGIGLKGKYGICNTLTRWNPHVCTGRMPIMVWPKADQPDLLLRLCITTTFTQEERHSDSRSSRMDLAYQKMRRDWKFFPRWMEQKSLDPFSGRTTTAARPKEINNVLNSDSSSMWKFMLNTTAHNHLVKTLQAYHLTYCLAHLH